MTILLVSADSGVELSSIDAPADAAGFSWGPDSRSLDFVLARGSASNLFRQPLPGGPIKQITNFESGRIFSSSWSPDGKQLVLARGQTDADVVLISRQ